MTKNKTNFSIKFDGPALANHTISVKDLAPALLAVGELFDELNELFNDGRYSIDVNIQATKEGSVDINLLLEIKSLIEAATTFLNFDGVNAVINAKELMEIVLGSTVGKAGAGVGSIGLIGLIKWARGRTPTSAIELRNGGIKLTLEGGDSRVVTEREFKVFNLFSIRQKMEAVVKPLEKKGIDDISISSEEVKVKVDKDEKDFFAAPEYGEQFIGKDKTQITLQLITINFQEGKWKVNDGNSAYWVDVKDQEYLMKMTKNEVAFSKNDLLTVEEERTQYSTKNGLKTDHAILRVIKHESAAIQMMIPFKESDEGDPV